jgi:MFS superfamily sulfate permease-like transporter
VPGGLLVVVIGIAAGQWLNLSAYGVKMIGLIDLSLEVPNLPVLPFADWLRLGEVAFAMVMILYAESYGSISAYALKHGDRVNSNRDMLALGASNLLSGLFHGLPAGPGIRRHRPTRRRVPRHGWPVAWRRWWCCSSS